MTEYQKIYNQLRETLTDEEIASSMLIPEDMTEQAQVNEELLAFRFQLLKERTEKQRIVSELMRLRFLIEDYTAKGTFSPEHSFGKYLSEYIRILNRTKKSLSEDLSVHYTRLSRIINDKEDPNVAFIYRLEQHAENLIPAVLWWKLVSKKQEYQIQQNLDMRAQEAAKVEGIFKQIA